MKIDRWNDGVIGRSQTVAMGQLVSTVATARNLQGDLNAQAIEAHARLDNSLLDGGSSRTHLLSVQVLLTDIDNRPSFDALWREWIGANPEHWPQRARFQANFAPGLLLEVVVAPARE